MEISDIKHIHSHTHKHTRSGKVKFGNAARRPRSRQKATPADTKTNSKECRTREWDGQMAGEWVSATVSEWAGRVRESVGEPVRQRVPCVVFAQRRTATAYSGAESGQKWLNSQNNWNAIYIVDI